MFLIDFRPEFNISDTLKSKLEYSLLEMDPLTKDDCIELVDFILGDIDLPDQVKDELLVKSSGNPFYIEEWLYLLKKRWKGEKYVFDEQELMIPDNINAIVLSRIDTLDDNDLVIISPSSCIVNCFFFSNPLTRLSKI